MHRVLKNKKSGFSLIEVIIAIFVLGVGVVSIVGLMAKNISYSINSRNVIIASELVQEGIELVRNIRDNNFAAGETAFQTDFPSVVPNTTVDNRIIDKASTNINNTGSAVLYNAPDGFYVHDSTTGNVVSQFQRKIMLTYGSGTPPTQVTVVSTVWWGGGSVPAPCTITARCVTATDVLTDWHQ